MSFLTQGPRDRRCLGEIRGINATTAARNGRRRESMAAPGGPMWEDEDAGYDEGKEDQRASVAT